MLLIRNSQCSACSFSQADASKIERREGAIYMTTTLEGADDVSDPMQTKGVGKKI